MDKSNSSCPECPYCKSVGAVTYIVPLKCFTCLRCGWDSENGSSDLGSG